MLSKRSRLVSLLTTAAVLVSLLLTGSSRGCRRVVHQDRQRQHCGLHRLGRQKLGR